MNISCSSVHAITASVKFLLRKGVKFVLTGKMNQDKLEQYFGKQRAAGGSNRNPTVSTYGQNAAKIECAMHLFPEVKGNISISQKK